jgi:hypothetical protein
MFRNNNAGNRSVLVAAVLAGSLVASNAFSQSTPATSKAPSAKTRTVASVHNEYASDRLPRRAQMYYESVWGIDSLKVRYTESGEMLRFSYRVLDPAKAAALNDKKAEPFLYDPQARVRLSVPQLEKVGKLRQSSTPIAGMSYWMAFSNIGRRVRPGHRVSIEIGHFRAINLPVE